MFIRQTPDPETGMDSRYDDPEFEITRHPVFLVETEWEGEDGDLRTIYVDTPSLRARREGRFFRALHGTSRSGEHVRSWSTKHPFESARGRSMRRVGWVLREDYVARITNVCQGVPPGTPTEQQDDGEQPLNPGEWCPCHGWTSRAVHALLAAGVLEPLRPPDNGQLVRRFYS